MAYNQTITAGGGTGTVALAVSNIQDAVPGLTVPISGTGSLAIGGTPTAAGTETFTLTATDSLARQRLANYSITVNAALSLTPAPLPTGTVSAAYNQTITASGGTGTVTLAVSNIQNAIPGLTVPAGGTGSLAISGTPTATGTETFTVTATDSLGATTTANYTITVDPELTLTPATLPADTVGVAYNQTITGGGGTGTVTLSVINIQGAIPGLTVPASGAGSLAITGTPTAAGTETFIVAVTDSLGATIAENYSITVNPARPRAGDAAGRHDRPALQPDDHRWRRHRHRHAGREQHPERHPRIDRSRQRHGEPGHWRHAYGRRDRDVHAHRHRFSGATTTTDYSITVNSAPASVRRRCRTDTTGAAYNQTITGGGGTGTLSLAVSNIQNAIPGLTVPASGTGSLMIVGTPTAAGVETFVVTVTDSLRRDNHGQLQHRGQLGAASQ